MGGLVVVAYARHPDKILGIIHGVQPAVGRPFAYRRMALHPAKVRGTAR